MSEEMKAAQDCAENTVNDKGCACAEEGVLAEEKAAPEATATGQKLDGVAQQAPASQAEAAAERAATPAISLPVIPPVIDEYLSANKYEVDEECAHIELCDESDYPEFEREFRKLMLVCPAGLYRVDDAGRKSFDYAGCLECGTCRIAGRATILSKWVNPQAMMGVEYRFG